MRGMLTIVGLVLIAPCAWGQDDAKKLFDAMHQKLAKAKAYKCDFEYKATGNCPDFMTMKGTLLVAAGNRLKITAEMEEANRKRKGLIVSDGKTRAYQGNLDGDEKERTEVLGAVPDKFSDNFTILLVHVGMMLATDGAHRVKTDIRPKVSGFKSVGKEKVGDRPANVIEYEVGEKGDLLLKCKLWLDAETGLPLKRIWEPVGKVGGGPGRVVEMYRGWELDPKLADDAFALPK